MAAPPLVVPLCRDVKDYLNWCIQENLTPSKAFFIFFTDPQFQKTDNAIVKAIGGLPGGLRLFMRYGGSQLFDFLATLEGIEWLRKPGNLEDFIWYIRQFKP